MAFAIAHCKQARSICSAKKKVGEVVLVHVTRGDAGEAAFGVQPDVGGYVPKRSVALIAEECRRRAVVHHEQIDIAVVVEVCRHHGNRVASRSGNFRGCGDVGEFAVAVVSEQHIRSAGEIIRKRRRFTRVDCRHF